MASKSLISCTRLRSCASFSFTECLLHCLKSERKVPGISRKKEYAESPGKLFSGGNFPCHAGQAPAGKKIPFHRGSISSLFSTGVRKSPLLPPKKSDGRN